MEAVACRGHHWAFWCEIQKRIVAKYVKLTPTRLGAAKRAIKKAGLTVTLKDYQAW